MKIENKKRPHAGQKLVNAVCSVITDKPATAIELRNRLAGTYSTRAVRYAVTELLEQGRIRRVSYRGRVCIMPKTGV